MSSYNNFCLYCTGSKRKDIRQCKDKYCPFYPFRFAELDKEDEKEIARKLLNNVGVTK